MRPRLKFQRRINRSMQLMAEARVTCIGPGIQSCGEGAWNLSHLEPIDCPLPNLQIFSACVISGIDLIFHSFYRTVILTSWDRGLSDGEKLSDKPDPLVQLEGPLLARSRPAARSLNGSTCDGAGGGGDDGATPSVDRLPTASPLNSWSGFPYSYS